MGLALDGDPDSLRSFSAPLDVEADRLTFCEAPESASGDRGKVNENVCTAIRRRDKTKTFGLVKPFYGT